MATLTLRPSGDGQYTEFALQNPGSGSHWEKVDEESADGDTTYVYSNGEASQRRDLFDVPSSGISASATINSVQIYARARGASASPGNFSIGFRDGTGDWWQGSPNALVDGVYNNYDTGALSTNPRTTNAWTLSEINALNIGVRAESNAQCVVTQVYAVVTYTDPLGDNVGYSYIM